MPSDTDSRSVDVPTTAGEVARAADAIAAARRGRHLLLLLDFDGTLCEFHPDPEAVELPEPRRRVLMDLASRPDATLGIVSGRRLDDIRRRTQLGPRVYYAGLHGLEIRGPGVSFVHPDASKAVSVLRILSTKLGATIADMPGVFVEDKLFSIVAHWRDASPSDAARVPAIVENHAGELVARGELKVMQGACMMELLPNIDWTKGNAVSWIRELVAASHDVASVYIGDDVTDEDGFHAVQGHGLAIAASRRVTGAQFYLEGPTAVEDLLRRLAAPPS